jgi:GT2 family glycosyltransferase
MSIPVIIPFYKNQRQLDLCLAALAKQDTPVDVRVHDNSIENLYYTGALNVGVKRAIREGHEYALLLTQDCYLRPDAVSQVHRFMQSHPRCGLAGFKQLLAADEDQIVHGGCTVAYPAGRHYSGRKSRGDCAVSKPMPWINGAVIFARLDAVIEFGLMDRNMQMLGSDSDWCFTARARGWEVWYCAEAEAVHEVGVSSKQAPPELEKIFLDDMNYWRDKWIGTPLHNRLATEFQPMITLPPGLIPSR